MTSVPITPYTAKSDIGITSSGRGMHINAAHPITPITNSVNRNPKRVSDLNSGLEAVGLTARI